MLREISELQNRAVDALVRLTCSGEKTEYTFRAPTGSGKTYMMADYMNRMLALDSSVVFLVSSLSKSDLARQNYERFCEYRDHSGFLNLDPYLISSEAAGEERICIPSDHNVYLLPRDLYKAESRLMQGPMLHFLHEMKWNRRKSILWLKDECHIATRNLDAIAPGYFALTVNFSATPNLKRGQHPDVEISDAEAERCRLVKTVLYGKETDTVETALRRFREIKTQYRNLLNVNPCLIIQISNKNQADEELRNEIMPALHQFPELKWMLIVNDPKECDTNDVFKAKRLPVARWKDYVRGSLSGIDVIIFKLVISEGWDIPRACMLYQARNSRSTQLDEQVVGRVKRNPRLLDYETLSEEGKRLAATAWVWGVAGQGRSRLHGVKLCGAQKDLAEEIRVKTTVIKPLEGDPAFDLAEFLRNRQPKLARQSIFELNGRLQKADPSLKAMIYDYAEDYGQWRRAAEEIDALAKESSRYRCDYAKSMALGGEASFAPDSYFYETEKYVRISSWVWKRSDGNQKFSFDSEAERDWAEFLKDISASSFGTAAAGRKKAEELPGSLKLWEDDEAAPEKELYLWGKNFLPDSAIKFEYYLGAVHASYPDFIMKDKKGRIHIFEVKSVNYSAGFTGDSAGYTEKAEELKRSYRQASVLTGQLFYLPVQKGNDWQITMYENGTEQTLTSRQFEQYIKA